MWLTFPWMLTDEFMSQALMQKQGLSFQTKERTPEKHLLGISTFMERRPMDFSKATNRDVCSRRSPGCHGSLAGLPGFESQLLPQERCGPGRQLRFRRSGFPANKMAGQAPSERRFSGLLVLRPFIAFQKMTDNPKLLAYVSCIFLHRIGKTESS